MSHVSPSAVLALFWLGLALFFDGSWTAAAVMGAFAAGVWAGRSDMRRKMLGQP